MNQIDWKPQDAMPSDIAAIGREFSRAIHKDYRRRTARHSRVRRAIIVVAVMGVGSGTALAAQTAAEHGYFLNPCIAHAVEVQQTGQPFPYTSLEEMLKACDLPSRVVPNPSPPAAASAVECVSSQGCALAAPG